MNVVTAIRGKQYTKPPLRCRILILSQLDDSTTRQSGGRENHIAAWLTYLKLLDFFDQHSQLWYPRTALVHYC